MTMTEHAFDPVPDEQSEGSLTQLPLSDVLLPVLPTDAQQQQPNATVTLDDVLTAIAAKHWTHENASIALWLNTSFPITTLDADVVMAQLQAYGIHIAA
jgi:hypothetical protein